MGSDSHIPLAKAGKGEERRTEPGDLPGRIP